MTEPDPTPAYGLQDVPPPPPAESSPPPPPPPPRPAPPEAELIFRFSANVDVIKWVGPAAILLALVLSVFPWMGAYPGGTAVYTQSAWGLTFGTFTAEPTGDEAMGARGPESLSGEKELRKHVRMSAVMMVFSALLLFAGLIAGLDLFEPIINFPVPDLIQSIWPRRHQILAVSGAVLFVLLQVALWSGVGLEAATAAAADAAVPALKGASPTTKELHVRQVMVGCECGRYAVTRTLWLMLASGSLVVGSAAYGLELWLTQRGRRPEPRVEFWW